VVLRAQVRARRFNAPTFVCHLTHRLHMLQMFDLCFKGQRAVVVVEGAIGRLELAKYLSKYDHLVGAWTQVQTAPTLSLAPEYGMHLAAPCRTLPHLAPRTRTLTPRTLAQATLSVLNVNLDYVTNVLSTNGGAIFEVYVHGFSTLVVLRPSTGSTIFSKYVTGGQQAALLILASLHNQMVVVGR